MQHKNGTKILRRRQHINNGITRISSANHRNCAIRILQNSPWKKLRVQTSKAHIGKTFLDVHHNLFAKISCAYLKLASYIVQDPISSPNRNRTVTRKLS